jgi:ABC-type nitrate/sulfonate/bicarbonate transport system permease component
MDDVPPTRAPLVSGRADPTSATGHFAIGSIQVGDRLLPWLSVVAALAVWELLSRAEIVAPGAVPPATHVLSTLWGELGEREVWVAIGQTLEGWALGLGVAAALAIPLGVVIGSSRLLYRSLRMIIELLRPIPSVALVPLAILV